MSFLPSSRCALFIRSHCSILARLVLCLTLSLFFFSSCSAPRVGISSDMPAKLVDLKAKGVVAISLAPIQDPEPAAVSTDVGVLDSQGLGQSLSMAIQAALSDGGAFEVNVQSDLAAIKAAQQFNMSGYVNSDQAPESFQLTGTKILMLGTVHAVSLSQELHTVMNNVFKRQEYFREGQAQMQASIRIIDVERGALVLVLPLNKKIALRNPSWSSSETEPAVFNQTDVIARLCAELATDIAQSIAPYQVQHFVALEDDAQIPAMQLGNTAAQVGDWADAQAEYQAALRINPHSAAAYFNLGLAQRALGDAQAAQQSFKRAYALQPKQKYLNELKR